MFSSYYDVTHVYDTMLPFKRRQEFVSPAPNCEEAQHMLLWYISFFAHAIVRATNKQMLALPF